MQMLEGSNLPLYYGGTVQGDPDEYVYEHVPAGEPGSRSNYVLGRILCAKLSSRFEKKGRTWEEDYIQSGKPRPNCWKKHEDNPEAVEGSVPAGVVEVALYDLYFNPELDSRTAELELERFKWKPFGTDSMNVIVFRGHVGRLMRRARVTGAFQRVRAIRNCLPTKLKAKVDIVGTEQELWKTINDKYITWEVDYIERQGSVGAGTGAGQGKQSGGKLDKPKKLRSTGLHSLPALRTCGKYLLG